MLPVLFVLLSAPNPLPVTNPNITFPAGATVSAHASVPLGTTIITLPVGLNGTNNQVEDLKVQYNDPAFVPAQIAFLNMTIERTVLQDFEQVILKPMPPASQRQPRMSDVEWQLRNWYNFVWLCGDSLVEQAVHSVDKMAWVMQDVPPLKAVAVGGRQIPAHGGNIFDHFEVNYEYADGVRGFLGCRQQTNCYGENRDYIMGAKGLALIGGRKAPVEINGEKEWRYQGPTPNMYQVEHDELFASIRSGKPINDGVRMAHSTLMAIMGRMAAYNGQEITWEQALNSQERLVPEKLDWNMALEAPPMAMPGITKFV